MKDLETKNKGLAILNRVFLICAICLISMPVALAQKHHPRPAVSIGGVYENFTVGQESGDLVGMRVIIFAAGGAYRAIVQSAEGGAEDPQPKYIEDVQVKGMTVTFAGFTGTVTAAGLRLKNSDGMNELLKRKPCAPLFNVGP
jgi:hypothetical protein